MTAVLFGDPDPETVLAPMEPPLLIVVRGRPRPQGSKSPFPIWARFSPVLEKCPACGQKRFVRCDVREAVKDAKVWRRKVTAVARDQYRAAGFGRPIHGAVALSLVFTFDRPPSHFTSTGALTADAPGYPGHGDGDLSKLVRSVEDSLTGAVWDDDTQVTDYVRPFGKYYTGEVPGPADTGLSGPGVIIKVWAVRS